MSETIPPSPELREARSPPRFADRFIDTIERIAAIFVGVVAADVFI